MITFAERVCWNARTYGCALKLSKRAVTAFLLVVALAIPVLAPVWAVPVVARWLPSDGYNIRYDDEVVV